MMCPGECRLFGVIAALSVWSCAASPIAPPGDGAIGRADGAFDDASMSDAARDASDESRDAEVGSDAAIAPDASPDASDGSPDAGLPSARAWEDEIVYFVIPDRFVNGDPSNDLGDDPRCFDPASPRHFHGGDWAGLAARVPYLTELGVTAVWITPPYRQVALAPRGCGYHGYWADFRVPDDGELEPRLGDAASLTRLVDVLHAAGIRVIFDLVVNHSGRGATIVAQRPSWFQNDEGCEARGPRDLECSLNGLPDFDHRQPEVAAYVSALSAGWVERFDFDGIRMDTVKHVRPEYFRDSFFPAVRAVRDDLFVLGEIFDTADLGLLDPYFATGFDSFFNFPLQAALNETFGGLRSVDLVASRMNETWERFGERSLLLTNFLDNHDVPRFVNRPGLAVSGAEIATRHRLALTALFTLPGIPQLYYGAEVGMYGGPDPDNRRDMPSWAFDPDTRGGARAGFAGDPAETFDWTRRLTQLRQSTAALRRGRYLELWRQNGGSRPNVLSFLRATEDDVAIVVLHAGTTRQTLSLPILTNPGVSTSERRRLLDGTVLEDALGSGVEVRVEDGRVALALPPLSALVLRPRR